MYELLEHSSAPESISTPILDDGANQSMTMCFLGNPTVVPRLIPAHCQTPQPSFFKAKPKIIPGWFSVGSQIPRRRSGHSQTQSTPTSFLGVPYSKKPFNKGIPRIPVATKPCQQPVGDLPLKSSLDGGNIYQHGSCGFDGYSMMIWWVDD